MVRVVVVLLSGGAVAGSSWAGEITAQVTNTSELSSSPFAYIVQNSIVIEYIIRQWLYEVWNVCVGHGVRHVIIRIITKHLIELWTVSILETSSIDELVYNIINLLSLISNSLPDALVVVSIILMMILNI